MKRLIPAFLLILTIAVPQLLAEYPERGSEASEGSNPPDGGPYPPFPGCRECEDEEDSGSNDSAAGSDCQAGDSDSHSIYFTLGLGTATYTGSNNFVAHDLRMRTAPFKGYNPPSTDNRPFARSLSSEWKNRLVRPVVVGLVTEEITEASFTPASLQLYGGGAGSAWVKKDASGVLRQILSDQYLTNITFAEGATTLSIYYRNTIGGLSGGFYTIPASAKLHRNVVISRPDSSSLDTLDILTTDYSSSQTSPKLKGDRWVRSGTAPNDIWTLTHHNGSPGSTPAFASNQISRQDLGGGVTQRTRTIRKADTSGTLITTSITREKYRNLGADTLRIVERVEALGTNEEITTNYTYTDLTGTGTVGLNGAIAEPTPGASFNRLVGARLLTLERSDGFWEEYRYDYNAGTKIMHTEIWSSWENIAFGDKANSRYQSIILEEGSRTVIEKIAGQIVSNEHEKLTVAADGTRTLRSERKTGTASAPLITEYAYFADTAAEPNKGRIKYTRHSDGTLTRYTYSHAPDVTNPSLSAVKTIIENGAVDAAQFDPSATGPVPAPTDGTLTVTLTNAFEHVIESKTTDIASGLILTQFLVANVDEVGRPTHIIHDGDLDDFEKYTYACCGVETYTARDGSKTSYFKDASGRPIRTELILGSKTTTTYQIYGTATVGGITYPKTTITQTITATEIPLDEEGEPLDPILHEASRFVSESVINYRGQTLISRSPDANNDDQPDETTSVYDVENRTHSTTGPDGVTQTSTSYADGQTHTSVSTSNSIAVTPLTTYDYSPHNLNGGGIMTSVTTSGEGLSAFIQHSYSDLAGRTFRTESPGHNGATLVSITIFDDRGRAVKQTASGQPDTLRVLNLRGEVIESWIDSNGDHEFNNTADGDIKDSYSKSLSDFVTEDGNISQRSRQWVRNDADDDILVSTTFRSPDGLYQKSIPLSGPVTVSTATKTLNGNSSSETRTYLSSTTFLSRLTTTTLNANGTTTAASVDKDTTGAIITTASQTADLQGRTVSTTGERGLTTSFDEFTDAGQPLKTIHSDGTYTRVTLNSAARPITQQTYKADDTLIATVNTSYHPNGQPSANWGTNTNPTFSLYDIQGRLVELRTYRSSDLTLAPVAGTPNYDKTTWSYESATGLLLAKKDAADKSVTYTYYDEGKLYTRTWARGVVTTYEYDTANRLVSTDYSDNTPAVTMSYDRLNRQAFVSNSIAKSEFAYNATTLAADTETISYDLDGQPGFEFSRVLDRSQDALGRDTGFSLGSASVPPTPAEVQASYGYSPTTARLATIGDATSAFRYDYLTNSSLIESVTATAGAVHTVTNTWELNRNVLSSKQNKAGTEILSKFDYSVNQLGQRESVATSGTAFPAVPSWAWGYDALGQVTSANHGANNNFDRAYQYDTIGNRIETVDGATTVTGTPNYTANPLNQYTVANGVTLPVTPAPAPYDFDGNLRFDGGVNKDDEARAYSWDAENRLIEVKRVEGDMLLTRYKYDAQSRLISRTQSPISNPQSTLFIYDAWNRIAEYVADASGHVLKRSYLFGMDLSGNMQGAGGVGGLLLLTDHSAAGTPSYYPTFDGNGNVSEYLDSIGVIKAHFEYDPFGRTLPTVPLASEDATLKATFDYRFSTKPIDSVTGWFYYGYRWYDPITGRWPSRDPIEEKGGMNLYGFVGNDGVNYSDYLGNIMQPIPLVRTVTVTLEFSCQLNDNMPSFLAICCSNKIVTIRATDSYNYISPPRGAGITEEKDSNIANNALRRTQRQSQKYCEKNIICKGIWIENTKIVFH